ncbi:glycosyltransferase family 2 protein [Alistipes sp.]|nr:Chondroitin polymerase [Faecalibacterium prausnitzii]
MKVSVAMCTYNGHQYIKEQLLSILEQTIPIDEIIICDDGSKDATIQIIIEYMNAYPGVIKLIKNSQNLGYTKNFEKAICLCSGDIIFLADQDDIWLPNKVQVICDFFRKHIDKEYVFTNAVLINSMGINSYDKTLFDIVGMDNYNMKIFNEGFLYDVLCVSGKVTGATTALRASFVPYCIPFPNLGKFAIHDGIMATTAAIWNKIACINQCLIKYRIHGTQSVGLGMLLKYPPRRYETADNVLMWHEGLVDYYREYDRNKLHFFYKRYWAIRSRFNIFKLFYLYVSGEYKYYYSKHHSVFIRDLKGVFVRLVYKIKTLDNYTITNKYEN